MPFFGSELIIFCRCDYKADKPWEDLFNAEKVKNDQKWIRHGSADRWRSVFFVPLRAGMRKQGELTHKEAVKKALEMLGGKAQLKQIYPVAIKLIGKNTRSVDIKATIRRELNSSPYDFKATPDVEGSWELVSYQEEVEHLKAVIAEQNKVIEEQKKVPTEDDFIQRLLEKLKTVWKDDKKTINEIRKILDALGRSDVVAELDNFLELKNKKTNKQGGKSSGKIVVNGSFYAGDHVSEKTVIPNVGNYQPQITTQNVETPMPSLGQQLESKQLEDE